jgi:hypothetical protein
MRAIAVTTPPTHASNDQPLEGGLKSEFIEKVLNFKLVLDFQYSHEVHRIDMKKNRERHPKEWNVGLPSRKWKIWISPAQ